MPLLPAGPGGPPRGRPAFLPIKVRAMSSWRWVADMSLWVGVNPAAHLAVCHARSAERAGQTMRTLAGAGARSAGRTLQAAQRMTLLVAWAPTVCQPVQFRLLPCCYVTAI